MPKKIVKELTIKQLDTIDEMMAAYPLVAQMYKDMDLETYHSYVEEMIQVSNFKMIGAFSDDKMVGVCGYWVLLMLYCGRYLQISNLVVDKDSRSLGVGSAIMHAAEQIGRDLNCQKFVLDSYTENKSSHSLYYREGFYIRGFHFMKDL